MLFKALNLKLRQLTIVAVSGHFDQSNLLPPSQMPIQCLLESVFMVDRIAALPDPKGTSTINNAGQIERGYERIDERLNALGARITRMDDRRR